MAILITEEAVVKTVVPKKSFFNIEELNEIVEGWIEPLKVGPLWVIYKEDITRGSLNEVASMVFRMPLRGKVLVVPVQQLPCEWDLMDEEDRHYTAEEVDCGFLLSLQTTLLQSHYAQGAAYSPNGTAIFNMKGKEEWMYDPRTDDQEDEHDENANRFLKEKVYPFLVNSKKKQLKEMLLFEDDEVVVKVKTAEDFLYTINRIIQVYVEEEEYEKCAQLQKIIDDLKSADKTS